MAHSDSAYLRLLDIPADKLAGKKILIRSDLNAPVDHDRITEDTRLVESLPAIQYCINAQAKVMVVSHRGRPTPGHPTPKDTLAPMADYLSLKLNQPMPLIRDWLGKDIDIDNGQVVMLENCRLNLGEKQDDDTVAKKMADMCDIYVNDAFGIVHRAEATTHGVAKFAKIACAGPLMAAELDALDTAVGNPKRPLLAIVGGAKVSTKLVVLKNLAEKVDHLIVGGGIANTFLLALGHNIGKSLCEPELVDDCKAIIEIIAKKGGQLPLPTDVVTAKSIDENAHAVIKSIDQIEDDDMILDMGSDTLTKMTQLIDSVNTIVFNGPIGLFEIDAFANGTKTVACAIANSPAFSVAGGGDTLAAVAKFQIRDKLDYVSTGGGAFLEFLEGRKFPPIEILEIRAKEA